MRELIGWPGHTGLLEKPRADGQLAMSVSAQGEQRVPNPCLPAEKKGATGVTGT